MAQSPEYPDLKWMPPRAFGEGRDGKAVRYIVIHYTAGSERSTSAEDGAIYDQKRTNGVSTHFFVDRNSIVQCVRTSDRANAARHRGNRLGIQYELCGTAQTRAQWLDAASYATLKLAAKQVARDCRKYNTPVRRLSVAETRRCWTDFPAGPKGIVGHVDCTNAYPEDGGDHTDPGPDFPWDVFLDLVRDELNGDDDVTKEELRAELNAFFGRGKQDDGTPTSKIGDDAWAQGIPNPLAGGKRTVAWKNLEDLATAIIGMRSTLNAVATTIASDDDVNEQEIIAGVLAGLNPSQVAALVVNALPAELAEETARETLRQLSGKLSAPGVDA